MVYIFRHACATIEFVLPIHQQPKSVWYPNHARMHTYLEFSLCLITLHIITMLITQTSSEKTAKTCVEIQPTGSADIVVQDNGEGVVHINFVLSDNCTGSLEQTVVKLATQETGRAVDYCTIVFHNNTCIVTDQSTSCCCSKTGKNNYSVSWKFNNSDESLLLRLSSRSTQGEKVIFLNRTVIPAYRTQDLPIKKLGPPEIIGICSGVVVAVVVAAVLIRKWRSGGSCARQLEGPAKEDREMTLSNVAVRQTQQNTGSSSGLQEQEDIQARPGSQAPPRTHDVVDSKAISLNHTIPKRKRKVYNHIALSSEKVTRSQGEVYNHIMPLTHTTPRSQTEVYSNIVTSNDMVISSEAPKCNPAIPSIHTTSRRQKPPDDTVYINYSQVRRHTMTSIKKEKRWHEKVYNHATPHTNSDSKGLAQAKFTIVPSEMLSPINHAQVCNNTLLPSCTGARSPTQVYNHVLPYSYSSLRRQAHECNQTIQCTCSEVRREEPIDGQVVSPSQTDVDRQEPVQSEFYDQAVFPLNLRRQVVHSMYDHISY